MGRKSAKQIAADKRKLEAEKNRKKKEVNQVLSSVASTILLSSDMCLSNMQHRLRDVEGCTGSIKYEDINYHFDLNRRETEHIMKGVLKSMEIDFSMDIFKR